MKRKIISIFLSLAMVLTIMPAMSMVSFAETPGEDSAIQPEVTYIDFVNGEPTGQHIPNATVREYTLVESDTTSFEDGKWYVVPDAEAYGAVTVNSRIVNKGTAHLILVDGAKLTVKGGIQNEEGKSLTIYGQSGGMN